MLAAASFVLAGVVASKLSVQIHNSRAALHYGIFFFLGVLIIAFVTQSVPFIFAPSSWPVYLLVTFVYGLPFGFLIIYLVFKLVVPAGSRMPLKGFRQWAVAYVLVLVYGLAWVLLAFLFEIFTPFIPLIFRGVVLPIYILLVPIIILSRTRLRDRFEQLLKRLFKEGSS